MTNAISPTQKQALQHVCAQEPTVVSAYLFGSHATGNARTDSDIDIAVVLAEKHTDTEGEIQLRLINELSAALQTNKVDVVILNTASVVLQFEAIKQATILYETTVEDRVTFERQVMRRYLDTQWYRERYYERKIDHLLQKGFA